MDGPLKAAIDTFCASFKGEALTPGDPGYDQARAIWNGAIDRKPAIIARCADAAQVAEAIRFARSRQLEIAVRGGGHNYAGHAVCDGGMMIHLGPMTKVAVDPTARRVACGGGSTWADVDAATQQHGLAAAGGFISHTGVGGLTLGGGIGWMTKPAGLTCDNLLSAEVVTADGRIVHASRDKNADLFWALRGGGGNFGVVTTFEFALHPIGPMVQLGLLFVGIENGAAALRFARGYIEALPEAATGFLAIALSAPPEPFVPAEHHFKLGHAILVIGFGSPEDHAKLVAPLRAAVKPLFELVTPIPFVALQQMFNKSAEWRTFGYEKALYLDDLSDAAIAVIQEHAPKKSSPVSFVATFPLFGRYGAVGEADTAFGGSRKAKYVFNIVGHALPNMPQLYEPDRAWVRAFWEAMRPHASGGGSYVNFIADVDDPRIRTSYGEEKYARLAAVKRAWDPDNVFHLNANIKPAK